ncbi:SdpI family protein [Neobacillus ginsengisoli]|uniref:Membrane protein n=1 Tax=Neobacillus ginsengisoli TaxID=904295 RepID=A0ABT9XS52_9BACI|nr:SdpI family protein [Neobacillus ginsengisoli]MDQ0197774.1 putative membrane protein [Neobacillus ginsengisoli]
MKNKFFYVSLATSLIALIINIIAYPHLPDKVPVHWGLNGEVNRYGSKIEMLMMGALPLLIIIFRQIIPLIDPKKESYNIHSTAYSIITLSIITFLVIINLIVVFSSLGYNISLAKVLPVLLGLLFIGMGNYMTQLRPNYFIGIRNPWTLASEQVWRKTHRLGGFVIVIIGLVPLSSIIIGALGMNLFFGALVLGIAVIFFYSYLTFKKNL